MTDMECDGLEETFKEGDERRVFFAALDSF